MGTRSRTSPALKLQTTEPLEPRPLPRRILVPIDFSPCSRKALCHAITLAQAAQAELMLLHVTEPLQIGWLMETEGVNRLRESANNAARGRLEELAAHEVQPHCPVKTMVREGKPFDQIVNVARDAGADLIVIGTHGHTKLKSFVLGSNAERVARHAGCPVLIVGKAKGRR